MIYLFYYKHRKPPIWTQHNSGIVRIRKVKFAITAVQNQKVLDPVFSTFHSSK